MRAPEQRVYNLGTIPLMKARQHFWQKGIYEWYLRNSLDDGVLPLFTAPEASQNNFEVCTN